MWDTTLLIWLNQLVARNPLTFFIAFFLSSQVSWLLIALILIALWFSGQPDTYRPGQLTRYQSRQRVLLIFLSAVVAFFLARWLTRLAFRPRPLVAALPLQTPLDPQAWAGIVASLQPEGAFPGEAAALWFVLAAGLYLYNWRAGLAAGLAGLFLSALQVGLGFHYPTDMIAGACVGILSLVGVFSIYQQLSWLTHPTIEFFEKRPVLAYPLGLLVMLDMAQRLTWFAGLLTFLFGIRL